MRWELANPCSCALRAISRLHTRVLLLGLAVSCAAPDDTVTYGETQSEISVGGAVTASCSTSIVRGLSLQIAREGECIRPGALVPFKASGNLVFASNAVLPFLHSGARTDLKAVAVNHRVVVASGFRTLAQQFLLVRWNALNRCGITVTAPVGRSNHETGRAADLSNASTVATAMRNHGWTRLAGDPPHFDHLSSPDNRGLDVRAFQRLWNRNHPGDLIAVDGDYGPQTEARLKQSPAGGFAKGAGCTSLVPSDGDDPFLTDLALSIDGPDLVAPDFATPYKILVGNNEDVDWPATTRMIVRDGTASELYDRDSWTSPSDAGELGVVVPAHGSAEIVLALRTPPVVEDTPFSTTLALVDGSRQLGTLTLAVTATPSGTPDTSSEDGEPDDGSEPPPPDDVDEPVEDTGCNAGGGSAGLALAAAFGLALRRRRRQPPR